MKKVKFLYFTDLNEAAAAYAALKVAKEIKRRGKLEVVLDRIPYKKTAQAAVWGYSRGEINEKTVMACYKECWELHERLVKDDNFHVIDWHNSPAAVLINSASLHKKIAKGYLPPVVFSLIEIKEKKSCFSLELDDMLVTNGRIVGALELPVVYQNLPQYYSFRKGCSNLVKWMDGKGGDFCEIHYFAEAMDFSSSIIGNNRYIAVSNVAENIKKGWLSEKLYLHLAEEIEKLILAEENYINKFPQEEGKPHRYLKKLLPREEEAKEKKYLKQLMSLLETKITNKDNLMKLAKKTVEQLEEKIKQLRSQARQVRNKSEEASLILKSNELAIKINDIHIQVRLVKKC